MPGIPAALTLMAALAACGAGSVSGVPVAGATPGALAPAAAGGATAILVPAPAPIVCTPARVVVGVSGTVIIVCTAPGYAGPFTFVVADPTVASVQQSDAPNSNPTGITAGPDGNLWFSEFNANKLAKITTAGVFTEYAIPTSGSEPLGIAPVLMEISGL
jgi:hypothetical protein